MKLFLWCIVTGFLLLILGSFVFWLGSPAEGAERDTIVSPLPDFLTLKKNNQVTLLDIWKPILARFQNNEPTLAPSATSALLFDLTTNRTLFEKNATQKLPMASLTKIMTAIIGLENPKENDTYSVKGADLVGEDSMGLLPGETLSLEELLYGLMLRSGNDAAEVLASDFPGGRVAFVEAMNKKAKALGLADTNFTNPSGLQGDGDQYTTAADLLVITKYALENFPLFRQVVSTFSHTIDATSTHQSYYLENETNLLTSYPGVKGVKTGYTPEAGLCLVTYLEYGGHRLIGVLLQSENRRAEMKELLDNGLKELGITPPVHD